LQFITGIVDTNGKFITAVAATIVILEKDVNIGVTGCNFLPVSMTPVLNLTLLVKLPVLCEYLQWR
jgi:hypothetical protein